MIKAIVIQSLRDVESGKNHFPNCISPEVDLVAKVHSVAEGIELVRKVRPNLVILDVDMPGDSAFRLFEETSDFMYDKIIVSDQSGHAIKAARYQVADYLLKPLCENDYRVAVERLLFSQGNLMIQQMYMEVCRGRKQIRLERIFLERLDKKRLVLPVHSIIRVQDMGEFQFVVTTDRGPVPVKKSLSKLSKMLVYNGFFHVPGNLLSLSHVRTLVEGPDDTVLVMEDGYEIPVPLSRELALRQRLDLPGGSHQF